MIDLNVENLSADALRNTMTLVRLTCHEWGDTKISTLGTKAATHGTNAMGNVGSFRKKLLGADASEVKDVRRILRSARESHYRLTRPFGHGVATIANAMMMDYLTAMAAHKKELDVAKAELVVALPHRIAVALKQLGGMADPKDYATPADIAARFGLEFEFIPMPAGAVDTTLPRGFAETMEKELEKRLLVTMKEGLSSGWTDVRDAVSHLVTTLEDPDTKRYHASLVTNVTRAARLMAAWNLTGDEGYDKLIGFISAGITCYTSAQLRDSITARERVAENGGKLVRLIDARLGCQ